MEEGVVIKWLKKVGETVVEGDILAEIETDKATMEFESFHEGTLLHIGIQEGESAKVDTLLAIIGKKNEDISELLKSTTKKVIKVETEEKKVAKKDLASKKNEDLDITLPEGIEIITMPRLSDTMTEGVVAQWHKKVGDTVEEGEVLAEIETDKATMEFESFQEGTLLYIGVNEGENAPVDSILAILGEAGTDVSSIVNANSAPVKTEEVSSQTSKVESKKTEAVNKQDIAPKASEVKQTKTSDGRILASPLAKKLASDKGIDIAKVSGTGESGRVVKRDIDSYKEPVVIEQIASAVSSPYQENYKDVKVSQMRKTIARRLVESKNEAPHYYLTVEIDMDQAIANRSSINDMPDTKVSFNDMVIKAAAMALKKHPNVNTSWQVDTVRHNEHVHIGVAIAVEDGLLVPVIRFADTKQLTQISAEVKDYAVRAKAKKLMPEDWEGSTFTISNLGMFGVEEFTSIINQPDSSILSVGAIVQKPVVKNGDIVVGNTMKVTMANDHRTVDGATGAMFLQTFKMYLENPVTMIA